MASVEKILRTCSLLFYCALCVCGLPKQAVEPWIVSFSVDAKNCDQTICKYWLSVSGGPFLGFYSWRLTPDVAPRGAECGPYLSDFEFKATQTLESSSNVEITVADSERRFYFCLHHSPYTNSPITGKWIHQGSNLFLDPKRDKLYHITKLENRTLNLEESTPKIIDLTHDIAVNYIHRRKPEKYEENDIEVFNNDNYIPFKNLNKDVYNENSDNKTKTEQDNNLNVDLVNKVGFEINVSNLIRKKRSDINNNNINSPILSQDANVQINDVTKEKTTLESLLPPPQDIINALKDNTPIYPMKHGEKLEDALIKARKRRQSMPFDVATSRATPEPLKLDGIRVEDSDKEQRVLDSKPSVFANSKVTLRLFGQGLTSKTVIAFTDVKSEYGQPCKYLLKGEYKIKADSITQHTALVDIVAPASTHDSLYICAKTFKSDKEDDEKYIHQGSAQWLVLSTYDKLLPMWLQIVFIIVCLGFSALFSGLNLGLMSLDKTELKIIANTGTPQEQNYARSIMPVRDHGNYLLCSILLGNVAVNSTLTLLLDDLTSGLFAVIFATLLIVMLGEITPQAICSRHGLKVGAKTIIITKAVMAVQAPLAYPISKLLDYFLGEEIGNVYNRERLKELVKVTTDMNDLDKYEVNIISGALELRKKTVADIMTKIEDVFMLPITSILDFETMNEIINSGFSRIPVYEGTRTNIITVLFVKDLAFVDPDDNTPLKTLCQYYQNPCNFVFEDVTLDVMFRQFKEGSKGHMAFVHRVNDQGDTDPFYEVVGLLTLEDVIEEMIQAEILDETDVYTDNTNHRRRRMRPTKLQDFSAFAQRRENKQVNISPQLTLATFQFLSTSVDEFRPEVISETVLRRLLKQDIIHHIKVKGKNKKDPSTYVFQAGKPVDYFVLILEGRVEVTVGREKLVFEAGPFTYFGVQALAPNVTVQADSSPTLSSKGSLSNINMDSMLRHSFLPDYSVRAVTELYYLTVRRSLYLAAKRATLMEQSALSKGTTNEQFDTEVDKLTPTSTNRMSTILATPSTPFDPTDKLLEGVNEDLSVSGEQKTPSRQVSPNTQITKSSPTFRERNSDMFPAPPPDEHEKLLGHQTTPSTYHYDERSQLNCGVFD